MTTNTNPAEIPVTPSCRRFGVEIEVVGITRAQAAEAVASVVGGTPARHIGGSYDPWGCEDSQGRTWKAVSDGSLTGYCNAEIVTPILSGNDDLGLLQSVVRAVRKAGGKVDESCGIHVHVDAAGLDAKDLKNLTKLVYKYEGLLSSSLKILDGRKRYCRELPLNVVERMDHAETLEMLNSAWYGQFNPSPNHYDHAERESTRYHGLNLHSVFYRGTVEFRWFNGTLHAGEIKSYVQFCLALVKRAEKLQRPQIKRMPVDGNAKFYFRCFLKDLGMTGVGYETARKHLLKHLAGESNYRAEAA